VRLAQGAQGKSSEGGYHRYGPFGRHYSARWFLNQLVKPPTRFFLVAKIRVRPGRTLER